LIEKELAEGFERELFSAALKNLHDTTNPLRVNNFSYSMRELMRHVLHRLAPDEKVLNCAWYKNEIQGKENGITRYQRAFYAVQGGLVDAYVKDTLEIEVKGIHKRLVNAINGLNKYTHIEPETINVPKEQGDTLVKETLNSFAAFLETINTCRKMILDGLWQEIDSAVVDEALKETICEIDALATHHSIDEICTENIVVTSIDHESVYFYVEGSVGCELQWGSNSDVRKGDGALLSESFPFTCDFVSPVTDPEAIECVESSFRVDTSAWYGDD